MKKILFSTAAIFLCLHCMAQEELSFPFQGGKAIMTRFFKDSLVVSPEIMQKKATGTVIFKFTADEKGGINKIIIYYADDPILAPPIIDALKKSNHQWIIPNHEKSHDFILPFTLNFNPPVTDKSGIVRRSMYNYYRGRKPIVATDQVPLDRATLLPVVVVSYDVTE